ncbi:MAG: cell wall hydrolase [Dyadobacter sp. 50-39]|uniref:N-acetylmuramoyl-L-alanine amidase family protein n=1 Tax=Dyadobacter sp. 50-39 TaxID=1895756 RepID=UPI000963D345|nr:N-acetylmuramoyl-L-alanine amidase [Dyadobacter sp. 50-39]OJV18558.1 MAG: cell wall hydrolase [Dyadobacter sp. 50-39]
MNRILLTLLFFTGIISITIAQSKRKPLKGKIICIDPGHGGTAATDSYRVGPGGEREEWVNLRVGLLLQKMLEKKGGKVVMTRVEDVEVPLIDRSKLAKDWKADLFVSIHHNATADSSVNFPIIYFHGNMSENVASVDFGRELAARLLKYLHTPNTPVSLVSDFTIFADAGASVLRNTYGMPALLAEASFFTNPSEEQRLKQPSHNRQEALAYTEAIVAFFAKPVAPITAKNASVPVIPPFKVFQEAERMTPIAKRWRQDFEEGKVFMAKRDTALLRESYELFTRSARSFPDSWLAGQCHQNRAVLLRKLGKAVEAVQEDQRFKEYYVPLKVK